MGGQDADEGYYQGCTSISLGWRDRHDARLNLPSSLSLIATHRMPEMALRALIKA
ncbi:hypothetical protein EGR_10456 [Echinococcus granulosus]|uniref:Uncharacterized protein n=1 Tax=Echinococcus granulosus TaxID=6210 RepID=W6UMH7_ECHGR|nr:hypothetical protein EGR_10456 [Echinococcus granulosus]EUB54694.1 hypothetical protein EGR_10456 [Echinococcus granulosus]